MDPLRWETFLTKCVLEISMTRKSMILPDISKISQTSINCDQDDLL